jgi:hypothetical protein
MENIRGMDTIPYHRAMEYFKVEKHDCPTAQHFALNDHLRETNGYFVADTQDGFCMPNAIRQAKIRGKDYLVYKYL